MTILFFVAIFYVPYLSELQYLPSPVTLSLDVKSIALMMTFLNRWVQLTKVRLSTPLSPTQLSVRLVTMPLPAM